MAGARSRVRTWVAQLWLLLQATAAGTTAWVIAAEVGNHPAPFFAPVTAVIVLNFARGERARYALRLLLGVGVGIAVGELTVTILGSSYLTFAVATFGALAVVSMFARTRLALNQAGASAILTVALAGGEAGFGRMLDALIGAGVAVVFTQLIFSPEPVALVRRAESMALKQLSEGLATTADALKQAVAEPTPPDLSRIQKIREALAEVTRARTNSQAVIRHGFTWRFRASHLAQVVENARQLELLGTSCLLLIRTAAFAEPPQRQHLASYVQDLARVLADLSADPGDQSTRQRAVNYALKVTHEAVQQGQALTRVPEGAPVGSLLMVVYDIMIFAGVAPEQAQAAMRQGADELPVIGLPGSIRFPFRRGRRPGR